MTDLEQRNHSGLVLPEEIALAIGSATKSVMLDELSEAKSRIEEMQ
jgi:hypothetical protein